MAIVSDSSGYKSRFSSFYGSLIRGMAFTESFKVDMEFIFYSNVFQHAWKSALELVLYHSAMAPKVR